MNKESDKKTFLKNCLVVLKDHKYQRAARVVDLAKKIVEWTGTTLIAGENVGFKVLLDLSSISQEEMLEDVCQRKVIQRYRPMIWKEFKSVKDFDNYLEKNAGKAIPVPEPEGRRRLTGLEKFDRTSQALTRNEKITILTTKMGLDLPTATRIVDSGNF